MMRFLSSISLWLVWLVSLAAFVIAGKGCVVSWFDERNADEKSDGTTERKLLIGSAVCSLCAIFMFTLIRYLPKFW